MAKPRTRVMPARKDPSRRDDDSLLVKSAESLGRVIGSLQRQVQGGSKQISTLANEALEALPELPRFNDLRKRATAARKPRVRRAKATRKTASAGAKKAAGSRTRAKKAGTKKAGTARRTSKKR